MTNVFTVPYGQGGLSFRLPTGMSGTLVQSRSMRPVPDPSAAVGAALAAPVAGPRLAELARPGDHVAIVVTDATRACPDHLLVPPLLDELERAGVPDRNITVVVGIGLHRPSTSEERRAKLGDAVVSRVRVVDPEPTNPAQLVDLGQVGAGIPALVNRVVAEADLVVATGVVEPHQYAGYSGGRKTIAIGAGSEAIIERTHSPAMLEHPRVRLDQIDGNPFHEAITEVARRAGLRFIVNVVADDDGQVVAVRAGAPEPTFASLVEIARSLFTVPIPRPVDVVVAGVGHPKDANLYQASRAATYLYFAPTPVVREGGIIVIPAVADEGAGAGTGERRFHQLLRDAPSASAVVAGARRHGYPAGGQRAFVVARVLEHCEIVVVGARDP
ncbi:MAG: nickel-dependent lactate racemase, partial [Chloroflexi bacterium]|nr:nickel-dependent lactate racemase [Chloroflexota bacterium]